MEIKDLNAAWIVEAPSCRGRFWRKSFESVDGLIVDIAPFPILSTQRHEG
jgi:hypothetical protein